MQLTRRRPSRETSCAPFIAQLLAIIPAHHADCLNKTIHVPE